MTITATRTQTIIAGALMCALFMFASGITALSAQEHDAEEPVVHTSEIAFTTAEAGSTCHLLIENNISVYPDNVLIITPGDAAEPTVLPVERSEGETIDHTFIATGGVVTVEVQWYVWTSIDPQPLVCNPAPPELVTTTVPVPTSVPPADPVDTTTTTMPVQPTTTTTTPDTPVTSTTVVTTTTVAPSTTTVTPTTVIPFRTPPEDPCGPETLACTGTGPLTELFGMSAVLLIGLGVASLTVARGKEI